MNGSYIAIRCDKCGLSFTGIAGNQNVVPPHNCAGSNAIISDANVKREFKILKDGMTTIQKTINQWKHQYEIEIVHIQGYQDRDVITICLWRTPK